MSYRNKKKSESDVEAPEPTKKLEYNQFTATFETVGRPAPTTVYSDATPQPIIKTAYAEPSPQGTTTSQIEKLQELPKTTSNLAAARAREDIIETVLNDVKQENAQRELSEVQEQMAEIEARMDTKSANTRLENVKQKTPEKQVNDGTMRSDKEYASLADDKKLLQQKEDALQTQIQFYESKSRSKSLTAQFDKDVQGIQNYPVMDVDIQQSPVTNPAMSPADRILMNSNLAGTVADPSLNIEDIKQDKPSVTPWYFMRRNYESGGHTIPKFGGMPGIAPAYADTTESVVSQWDTDPTKADMAAKGVVPEGPVRFDLLGQQVTDTSDDYKLGWGQGTDAKAFLSGALGVVETIGWTGGDVVSHGLEVEKYGPVKDTALDLIIETYIKPFESDEYAEYAAERSTGEWWNDQVGTALSFMATDTFAKKQRESLETDLWTEVQKYPAYYAGSIAMEVATFLIPVKAATYLRPIIKTGVKLTEAAGYQPKLKQTAKVWQMSGNTIDESTMTTSQKITYRLGEYFEKRANKEKWQILERVQQTEYGVTRPLEKISDPKQAINIQMGTRQADSLISSQIPTKKGSLGRTDLAEEAVRSPIRSDQFVMSHADDFGTPIFGKTGRRLYPAQQQFRTTTEDIAKATYGKAALPSRASADDIIQLPSQHIMRGLGGQKPDLEKLIWRVDEIMTVNEKGKKVGTGQFRAEGFLAQQKGGKLVLKGQDGVQSPPIVSQTFTRFEKVIRKKTKIRKQKTETDYQVTYEIGENVPMWRLGSTRTYAKAPKTTLILDTSRQAYSADTLAKFGLRPKGDFIQELTDDGWKYTASAFEKIKPTESNISDLVGRLRTGTLDWTKKMFDSDTGGLDELTVKRIGLEWLRKQVDTAVRSVVGVKGLIMQEAYADESGKWVPGIIKGIEDDTATYIKTQSGVGMRDVPGKNIIERQGPKGSERTTVEIAESTNQPGSVIRGSGYEIDYALIAKEFPSLESHMAKAGTPFWKSDLEDFVTKRRAFEDTDFIKKPITAKEEMEYIQQLQFQVDPVLSQFAKTSGTELLAKDQSLSSVQELIRAAKNYASTPPATEKAVGIGDQISALTKKFNVESIGIQQKSANLVRTATEEESKKVGVEIAALEARVESGRQQLTMYDEYIANYRKIKVKRDQNLTDEDWLKAEGRVAMTHQDMFEQNILKASGEFAKQDVWMQTLIHGDKKSSKDLFGVGKNVMDLLVEAERPKFLPTALAEVKQFILDRYSMAAAKKAYGTLSWKKQERVELSSGRREQMENPAYIFAALQRGGVEELAVATKGVMMGELQLIKFTPEQLLISVINRGREAYKNLDVYTKQWGMENVAPYTMIGKGLLPDTFAKEAHKVFEKSMQRQVQTFTKSFKAEARSDPEKSLKRISGLIEDIEGRGSVYMQPFIHVDDPLFTYSAKAAAQKIKGLTTRGGKPATTKEETLLKQSADRIKRYHDQQNWLNENILKLIQKQITVDEFMDTLDSWGGKQTLQRFGIDEDMIKTLATKATGPKGGLTKETRATLKIFENMFKAKQTIEPFPDDPLIRLVLRDANPPSGRAKRTFVDLVPIEGSIGGEGLLPGQGAGVTIPKLLGEADVSMGPMKVGGGIMDETEALFATTRYGGKLSAIEKFDKSFDVQREIFDEVNRLILVRFGKARERGLSESHNFFGMKLSESQIMHLSSLDNEFVYFGSRAKIPKQSPAPFGSSEFKGKDVPWEKYLVPDGGKKQTKASQRFQGQLPQGKGSSDYFFGVEEAIERVKTVSEFLPSFVIGAQRKYATLKISEEVLRTNLKLFTKAKSELDRLQIFNVGPTAREGVTPGTSTSDQLFEYISRKQQVLSDKRNETQMIIDNDTKNLQNLIKKKEKIDENIALTPDLYGVDAAQSPLYLGRRTVYKSSVLHDPTLGPQLESWLTTGKQTSKFIKEGVVNDADIIVTKFHYQKPYVVGGAEPIDTTRIPGISLRGPKSDADKLKSITDDLAKHMKKKPKGKPNRDGTATKKWTKWNTKKIELENKRNLLTSLIEKGLTRKGGPPESIKMSTVLRGMLFGTRDQKKAVRYILESYLLNRKTRVHQDVRKVKWQTGYGRTEEGIDTSGDTFWKSVNSLIKKQASWDPKEVKKDPLDSVVHAWKAGKTPFKFDKEVLTPKERRAMDKFDIGPDKPKPVIKPKTETKPKKPRKYGWDVDTSGDTRWWSSDAVLTDEIIINWNKLKENVPKSFFAGFTTYGIGNVPYAFGDLGGGIGTSVPGAPPLVPPTPTVSVTTGEAGLATLAGAKTNIGIDLGTRIAPNIAQLSGVRPAILSVQRIVQIPRLGQTTGLRMGQAMKSDLVMKPVIQAPVLRPPRRPPVLPPVIPPIWEEPEPDPKGKKKRKKRKSKKRKIYWMVPDSPFKPFDPKEYVVFAGKESAFIKRVDKRRFGDDGSLARS